MKRLAILAKGNLDLRDTLVAYHEGGTIAWNGINQAIRARFPAVRAYVRHETWTRSDALLTATGVAPGELAARDLPLGAYPLASQFATTMFDGTHDAIILSIQPDVMTVLARHRDDATLFYPHGYEQWPAAHARWLADRFVALDLLGVDESMANFAALIARVRAVSDAAILVYTMSSSVVGEWVHDHAGLDETMATRIRRFNLGLIDLSRDTGISIVDVDAVVAREGARRLTVDPLHLNAEGCRLVAEEVVRVLDDLGCLAGEA